MEVHELVIEMKLLERRMTLYEEKYGVLSEDFYAALMAGELAEYDAHDETRADFSRWKGIYETWKRRKAAYQEKLQERELAKLLRKHHRIPAIEMRYNRPNLPALINEIEEIGKS